MDTHVFRHVEGFGPYQRPRPPIAQNHQKPIPQLPRETSNGDGDGEASHRIAHTLTACCRCRQVSILPTNNTLLKAACISAVKILPIRPTARAFG